MESGSIKYIDALVRKRAHGIVTVPLFIYQKWNPKNLSILICINVGIHPTYIESTWVADGKGCSIVEYSK